MIVFTLYPGLIRYAVCEAANHEFDAAVAEGFRGHHSVSRGGGGGGEVFFK